MNNSKNLVLFCALWMATCCAVGVIAQETTTTNDATTLQPHATSISLEDLLNDSTVFDGSEDPDYDWGDWELPIVRSGRTEPLTPADLKNATMIASGYKEAFLLWKQLYRRAYPTNLEEQSRYRNFLRNMGSAYYNQTINPHALFGANNFSDYSPLEFKPYHNLTETYERFTNKSTATKGPAATGEDGYDILQNPFGQDFALYDQQGEFTVLGRGSSFWRNPNGNARKLRAQGIAKESSQSPSAVSASEGNVKNSIKALRQMLAGHESTPDEEAQWAQIESTYISVRNALSRWGDMLWSDRKGEGPNRDMLNAASDFNNLESQYFKKKTEREETLAVDAAKRSFNAAADVPTVLDWRSYGAVSPVRDQAFCGGCWAFATAGNIEGVWRIAGKPLVELSEQSLISCDVYSGNLGCGGGVPQYAYNYIIKYQGGLAARRDSYPFTSASGVAPQCAQGKYVGGAAINRYVSIAKDESVMHLYVANIGPISVAIDSTSWISYTGGIVTDCLSLGVDHAVLIVGFDIANNPPYWIIKNSWGSDWGEEGYIRLAKGSNQCLITKNPSTALANVAAVIATPSTTTTPTPEPTEAPTTTLRPTDAPTPAPTQAPTQAQATDSRDVEEPTLTLTPPPETTASHYDGPTSEPTTTAPSLGHNIDPVGGGVAPTGGASTQAVLLSALVASLCVFILVV